MHICHYAITPCAHAPDAIAAAINHYTPHTAEVTTDRDKLAGDVVHFHNRYVSTRLPCLIQYHSEPHRVDLECAPNYRLVLAQYHATLPEYAGCRVVRNVILGEHDPYAVQRDVPGIRIGYSPSFRGSVGWFDKGYERTKDILHRVSEQMGCTYDLVQSVPLDVCLERKSHCNVLIDECVTGSYHRCTLEALALGKLAICHLSPQVDAVARNACGSTIPVVNVPIDRLEAALTQIVRHRERIVECGVKSREWFLRHWHPRDLAAEYVGHYERVLTGAE